MEFERKRILTCVTADQARIGDIGWCGDHPNDLETEIKSGYLACHALELVDPMANTPFMTGGLAYAFFYPAPYSYLQKNWVTENDLTVGTRVRITRSWRYGERGFDEIYITHYLNSEGEVISIRPLRIEVQGKNSQMSVPYFALEILERNYASLQAEWVKENSLEIGDLVYVSRGWEEDENGFSHSWDVPVSQSYKVLEICEDGIRISAKKFISACKDVDPEDLKDAQYPKVKDFYFVPYFAIEKVKESKPEYRPFANGEEFAPHRDRWLKPAEGHARKVVGYNGIRVCIAWDGYSGLVSYDDIFKWYVFDDTGEPVGVKK